MVVSGMSKIHSESNPQLCQRAFSSLVCCVRYVKDKFWKQSTTLFVVSLLSVRLCPVCQRYILKAIHNFLDLFKPCKAVVSGMSKIHSESNPQLIGSMVTKVARCVRYVKDTFWKQSTTSMPFSSAQKWVVSGMSKIHSESNPQHKKLLFQLLPPNKSPQKTKPLIFRGYFVHCVIPERLELSTDRTGICYSIHWTTGP